MQLSIRGKNEILTKKEIRYITKSFGEFLLGPRLSPNVSIQIQYLNMKKDEWGYCFPLDDDRQYHREFEMLLNPGICKKNQIRTIAHELAHIHQFSRGLLKHKNGSSFKWMGKIFDTDNYDYDKIPWEKDAMKREIELYEWYRGNLA